MKVFESKPSKIKENRLPSRGLTAAQTPIFSNVAGDLISGTSPRKYQALVIVPSLLKNASS